MPRPLTISLSTSQALDAARSQTTAERGLRWSGNETTMEGELSALERSASVMRKELNNLRRQVESLRHVIRSEVMKLRGLLTQQDVDRGLFSRTPTPSKLKPSQDGPTLSSPGGGCPQGKIALLSDLAVGRIRTCFKEKNGTPRQPSLCTMATGVLTIEVFTNPSHSLEGLQEYSHVWCVLWLPLALITAIFVVMRAVHNSVTYRP